MILAVLLLIHLAGCSSGVGRLNDVQAAQIIQPGQSVKSIAITFTPAAQDELADNLRFNQNVLLDNLTRAFQARQQYDATAVGGDSIEVKMTHIRVRSPFNAIIWGFMAGTDVLQGEVYIRNAEGTLINHFAVHAGYALGGFAGGNARMGWLYDQFSELLVQQTLGLRT